MSDELEPLERRLVDAERRAWYALRRHESPEAAEWMEQLEKLRELGADREELFAHFARLFPAERP